MAYIVVEYLTYIIVVTLLGAVLFGTSAVALLSQEGAKYLARNSRKVAERTLQAAAATAKTAAAVVVNPSGHHPVA